MSPSHHSQSHGSNCCGIQIDFYEVCGHTLTLTDHSPCCSHFFDPFLTPAPTAYLRPSHESGSSTPPRPKPEPQPSLTTIPDPELNCLDLHRYIRLFPTSCTCTNALNLDLYPSTGQQPTRSDPHHVTIPKSIIFIRRMHFLHQQHLLLQYSRSIHAEERSYSLSQQRALEIRLRVPWMKRVFIFDPCGEVGDFFSSLKNVESLRGGEKVCRICREEVSQEGSRRLPCGCVLDVKCVMPWLRERKDCPVCRREFRLVWVGSVRGDADSGRGACWRDDELSGFI